MMTKAELNEALDELGVNHDPKATNAVLEGLLDKALDALVALPLAGLVWVPDWALKDGPGTYDPNTLIRPIAKRPGKMPHGRGGHWVTADRPRWAP